MTKTRVSVLCLMENMMIVACMATEDLEENNFSDWQRCSSDQGCFHVIINESGLQQELVKSHHNTNCISAFSAVIGLVK